jgi:hypothetical protein
VARATSRGKQKLILKIMEKMTGLMENLKLTGGEDWSSSHRFPVQQDGRKRTASDQQGTH